VLQPSVCLGDELYLSCLDSCQLNVEHVPGIVMLLRQLHKMAKKDGGAVYMLNGNHESLNICGDYRYGDLMWKMYSPWHIIIVFMKG
jgi:hypothetical protein